MQVLPWEFHSVPFGFWGFFGTKSTSECFHYSTLYVECFGADKTELRRQVQGLWMHISSRNYIDLLWSTQSIASPSFVLSRKLFLNVSGHTKGGLQTLGSRVSRVGKTYEKERNNSIFSAGYYMYHDMKINPRCAFTARVIIVVFQRSSFPIVWRLQRHSAHSFDTTAF